MAVRLADGDSFRLGEHRYRLYGIDAPELHQDCKDADGKHGPAARGPAPSCGASSPPIRSNAAPSKPIALAG